jgi:hypothetical protein
MLPELHDREDYRGDFHVKFDWEKFGMDVEREKVKWEIEIFYVFVGSFSKNWRKIASQDISSVV